MNLIDLSRVKVAPKRQRSFRSEEDHRDLFISISEGEAGLMHAPALWFDEKGEPWLVVGEGRIKVIREMYELGMTLRYEGQPIPAGKIPYTIVGAYSKLGLYEAEYDENVRRTPLTVAEKASATMHLFELKKMKAEAEGKPTPTVADLSVELRGSSVGGYQTETKKELVVAKHLDDPEVRGAKSIGEAYNVVKKKETQRRAAAMAAAGMTLQSQTLELHHAEAVAWLQSAANAQFDIVLSDPPYGMGADTFGQYGEHDKHRYDDSFEAWEDLMVHAIPEVTRVCKPDAHLYLFCDFDRFHTLKGMLETNGWAVHRTPLIWYNPVGFRVPWPEYGPQRKYEFILYARRGEKKTLKVMPDVIECVREKESLHAAQKPVGLLRDLLSRSALPTDRVLDFCVGSGSTLVACHEMKLSGVGLEEEDVAYGTALARIQRLTKGETK